MDSDAEHYDDENDSGNVSTDDNDDNFAMDVDINSSRQQTEQETYTYEVLSPEEIMNHMVDCIREVNSVVEVCPHD